MPNKLDDLSELRALLDVQRMNHDKEVKVVMNFIKDELTTVEDKWAPMLADTQDRITALEVEIRAEVLKDQKTMKGDKSKWQAIYMKGRETWDGKLLSGYAAAHPEINQFKKVGEPSVTIRGG